MLRASHRSNRRECDKRSLDADWALLSCSRWSALLMVVHAWRHAEPRMHRFLKDRVAGRRKCRCLERTHCNSADLGVAVPFPIEGGAATRAKMKSDAVAAVGIALVNLPLAVEPHPLFGIRRTEMESRAGAPLARLAVAKVNPIRLTRGDYSKRAAVALTGLFHRPSSCCCARPRRA